MRKLISFICVLAMLVSMALPISASEAGEATEAPQLIGYQYSNVYQNEKNQEVRNIRFVAAGNDETYRKVGFDISAAKYNKQWNQSSANVYNTILAMDTDGKIAQVSAKTYGAKYLFTYVVKGVPAHEDIDFTVKAYAVAANEGMIYGAVKNVTVKKDAVPEGPIYPIPADAIDYTIDGKVYTVVRTLDELKAVLRNTYVPDIENPDAEEIVEFIENNYVILGCDIDGNGETIDSKSLKIGKGSVIEGNGYTVNNFLGKGIFELQDGAEIVIRNVTFGKADQRLQPNGALFCSSTESTTRWQNVSVYADLTVNGGDNGVWFGKANGTHTFENCSVTTTLTDSGAGNAAGWVGLSEKETNNWTFTGCNLSGSVSSKNIAGGLIAYMAGSITVSHCTNCADITGDKDAGGFIGHMTATNHSLKVGDSVNEGNIRSDESAAGGLMGTCGKAATITNCTNSGKISGKWPGGMIGYTQGSEKKTITGCTNFGMITGTGKERAGGLVAYVFTGGEVEIKSSINNGTVTSNSYAGGIVGGSAVKLTVSENCSNTGNVTGSSGTGGLVGICANEAVFSNFTNSGTINGVYTGGLIGYSEKSNFTVTITNCINSAAVTGTSQTGGIIGWVFSGDHNVEISKSINTGNVTSTVLDKTSAGGIVGRSSATGSLTVDSCLNAGSIKARFHVAGIVGQVEKGISTITKCANIGYISNSYSTPSDNSASNIGGYLMPAASNTVTDCYSFGELKHDNVSYPGIMVCKYSLLKSSNGNMYYEFGNTTTSDKIGLDGTSQVETLSEAIELLQALFNGQDGKPAITFEIKDGKICMAHWSLNFPVYTGGTLAESAYVENYGYASTAAVNPANYKVIVAGGTTSEEFAQYVQTLNSEGYVTAPVNALGAITAYRVSKGNDRMYMYFSQNSGEARFVVDQNEGVLPENFSYTYEKGVQDHTVLYLYGLRMDANGINVGEKYPDGSVNTAAYNCGQMLVMKLADNSVMIIDGGVQGQMSKEAAIELNSFLHEITGVPSGEKVRISNWIITHCHLDHFGGFARFLIAYHEQYQLERMCFNFNYIDGHFRVLVKDYLNQYYPNLLYYRPHTGETVRLADIEMNFLYTYEDMLDAKTGRPTSTDLNDSSLVVKITFDGKSFLLTGDMYYTTEKVLMNNYSKEILKSDIMQVPHHGWNNTADLFQAVNPSISLYPQSSGGAEKGLGGYANTVRKNVIKYTAGSILGLYNSNVYYAGDQTVGVEVVNGKVTVVDKRNVAGTDYDGQWGMFDLII